MAMHRLLPAVVLAIVLVTTPLLAQDTAPSSQEIIDALLPLDARAATGKTTRSLGIGNEAATDRGIKTVGGTQAPFIDLRINFEYDSAVLSNDAQIVLARLGAALQAPELAGSTFRIVGHTDATGSEEYNDDLSRRRAEAVVGDLVANHGVAADRLDVSYRGEAELMQGIPPENERNRRVEIQNIGPAAGG